MFYSFPDDFRRKQFKPGAMNHFFWGDTVLVSCVTLEPNRDFGTAIHPYEQVSIVLEGELEWEVGDEVRILRKGDGVVIPANTHHRGRTSSSAAIILECFGPECKEDYLG